jgi:hypothetical protein
LTPQGQGLGSPAFSSIFLFVIVNFWNDHFRTVVGVTFEFGAVRQFSRKLGNYFLKCCFPYFPNSHSISIGNNQKKAEL